MPLHIRTGIRTREACDLAGIDVVRFNEMVNAGHFPCAPKTRQGAVRLFDLDQTVTLIIFGHLLSMSVAPQRAGEVACAAFRMFAGADEPERLVYCCSSTGEWTLEAEDRSTGSDTPHEIKLQLNIGKLRERLREGRSWNYTIVSRVKSDAS